MTGVCTGISLLNTKFCFAENCQSSPQKKMKFSIGEKPDECLELICSEELYETQNEDNDKVNNYAHLVLELGMLYLDLLAVCKSPSRERLLALLKSSMIVFKPDCVNSNYAQAIHRFLIQQISTMSEKEAAEVVQGMFINTNGKSDGYIPSYLPITDIIKAFKKQVKYRLSNKAESYVAKNSQGFSAVQELGEHFNEISNVKERFVEGKVKDPASDELKMIKDLRRLRPFSWDPGRVHSAFLDVRKSVSEYTDRKNYSSWLTSQIEVSAKEMNV